MSYSKLHSSIVNSSLWTESDTVRLLFVTLLAMCDRDGVVYGSRGGINRLANIDPESADAAWEALLSPDRDSSDRMRAPEHEGRRLQEVPGGFKLLNFSYYRGLRNDDDRREQNRKAQARFKAKTKPNQATVSRGNPESASISLGQPQKAHTEAEAEAEATDPMRVVGTARDTKVQPAPPGTGARLHGLPITVDEVIAHGAALHPKVDEVRCRAFFAHYEGQARTNPNGDLFWITSGEAVITNWKAKLPTFEGKTNGPDKNHSRPGADRNANTANAGKASQYRGVGKVSGV